MIDWLITLLPYQKYAGYILASYSISLISLLLLIIYFIQAHRKILQQLRLKYQREAYQKKDDK